MKKAAFNRTIFTDQTGRTITLPHWPPRRILSLVPSQTELLYDLDLEAEVIGITKFCVHPPEWFRKKKRVGGTKTVDYEKVHALEPDLIIGNKEENERVQIEALAARYPVWVSDVRALCDACWMIRELGVLVNRPARASALVQAIEQAFAGHRPAPARPRIRAAYFIWRKPYMIAAGDTFIQAMLREAGFENIFADRERYPEIQLAELAARQPEVILLSSEPFPFAEKHVAAFRDVCPHAEIRIVDGEMFSWYGSRLRHAPAYFRRLRESLRFAAG